MRKDETPLGKNPSRIKDRFDEFFMGYLFQNKWEKLPGFWINVSQDKSKKNIEKFSNLLIEMGKGRSLSQILRLFPI